MHSNTQHSPLSVYIAPHRCHLVQGGDHDPLALDLPFAQANELVLHRVTVHHCLTDMDTHGEAVALHAAGRVDCVPEEAVAWALHANHASIRAATVHPCRCWQWYDVSIMLSFCNVILSSPWRCV